MSLGKTFLAIGIALLLAFFVAYAVNVIYEEERTRCNGLEDCKNYTDERQEHSFNTFLILSGLGLVAIIIGLLLYSVEGIGVGIFGGGILIAIWSVVNSWSDLHKYLKLGVIFILLVLVIALGYFKIVRKPRSKMS